MKDGGRMLETNRIHCGDCLELLRDIEDRTIDLIVTDPPFFVLKQNKKLENCEWDNFENMLKLRTKEYNHI